MAYIDVSGLAGITLLAGIDPVTRDFYLSAATVDASIHPIDIYKEMRICRRLNEALRGYDLFLAAFGNVAKGGGKFTERYVQQLLGTRFIPYDISHELTVIGTVITDDGQEGVACFDRSPLTATTIVDISYVPPQVEVVRAEAELAAITQAAFDGGVTIDTVNGYAGTGIAPNNRQIGTRGAPSNNVADAETIAHANGLVKYYIAESATIGVGDDFGGEPHKVIGDSPQEISLTINAGANVNSVNFQELQLSGQFGIKNVIRDCIVGSITNANGFIYNSALIGPIQANADLSIQGCWNIAGTGDDICIIDFNSLAIDIDVTGLQSARIKAINMVTGSSMYCGGDGHLEIDASCTGGTLRTFGAIHTEVNGTLDTYDPDGVGKIVSEYGMTEAYPVDGQSSQSPAALLYAINQMLSEFVRTDTTVSVKKRDGTEAFQIELDSATAPTSATQSS